ncbi:hypothetical protein [Fervidibacillus halotolerans]|uniref:Uncharacterized protein n=1 Tax=Fervidibacillus halotolerans TaxID=2980027 RepID=A0A9E8M1I4_9BACI|nr:hypothetical protein [Fervidibacillus halotolerans]WAA13175.1 hypothetical protein OE105_03330 [Fervidibacillus halotolerans]
MATPAGKARALRPRGNVVTRRRGRATGLERITSNRFWMNGQSDPITFY